MTISFTENNALAKLAQKAAPPVVDAIQTASDKTGVNFAYLLEQAAVESSFNADAKAKTSSATGLYQFIEKTWLAMVRDHGDKYGLGDMASKIDDNGRVANKSLRREILELRKDPEIASYMAAEFAADNKRYLEQNAGKIGDIGATELYLAHFLGAGGAAAFLKQNAKNPLVAAADIMPQAARANHNIFYNTKTGKPRTVGEVYALFDKKFAISNDSTTTMIAENKAPSSARGNAIPFKNAQYASLNTNLSGKHSTTTKDADDVLARGPLLPALSPFAHLNTRKEDGNNINLQQNRLFSNIYRTSSPSQSHSVMALNEQTRSNRAIPLTSPVSIMEISQTV
jgi:hypothetical protein